MLYRGSHYVRHPESLVDYLVAHVTNPAMLLKKNKRLNIVSLGVDCSALGAVVFSLILAGHYLARYYSKPVSYLYSITPKR